MNLHVIVQTNDGNDVPWKKPATRIYINLVSIAYKRLHAIPADLKTKALAVSRALATQVSNSARDCRKAESSGLRKEVGMHDRALQMETQEQEREKGTPEQPSLGRRRGGAGQFYSSSCVRRSETQSWERFTQGSSGEPDSDQEAPHVAPDPDESLVQTLLEPRRSPPCGGVQDQG